MLIMMVAVDEDHQMITSALRPVINEWQTNNSWHCVATCVRAKTSHGKLQQRALNNNKRAILKAV
jgi:hypothetical protein